MYLTFFSELLQITESKMSFNLFHEKVPEDLGHQNHFFLIFVKATHSKHLKFELYSPLKYAKTANTQLV